ncbi:chitinase-like protein Idgf3 [Haematobia irritans]|uniref:chitinase-like protein Idgf3 n=1 Tax=Haematobia irritans TaxID=7368 RepID=UPI003F4FBA9D
MYLKCTLAALFLLLIQSKELQSSKIVCFFDSSNPSEISLVSLEIALGECSHFIYGYAAIIPHFYRLFLDGTIQRSLQVTDIAELKKKFPHVKFLLSLGGNRDSGDTLKYLQLLETKTGLQESFIGSVLDILKRYNFDGLDLAYQFPTKEVIKESSYDAGSFWRGISNIFKSKTNDETKFGKYKPLFTKLVKTLGYHMKRKGFLLTLSVLPNVKVSWFIDIPALTEHLDFINLWAFDFVTPRNSPLRADFPAPLYAPTRCDSHSVLSNINSLVQYWMGQNITKDKLILGIPSYGHTWKMSSQKSWSHNKPPVENVQGPSTLGKELQTPGLVNWLEICLLLKNRTLVVKGSYDHGQYFVFPSTENFHHDTWITFDAPNVAYQKTLYASEKGLGGVALMDLSCDDYSGSCTGLRFPILRYMKGIFTEKDMF